MNILARRSLALVVLALLFMPTLRAADVPRELHGSGDAFAAPGLALAWGVLRGANEDTTQVVLRVVTDPVAFSEVAVTGVDPFTQGQEAMRAMTPSPGSVDVRTPRAHFARYPRTELRFRAPAAETASLLVFYLGVPDTTPEFADEAKLDAYLRERIAKVRGSTPP
jgi:hypothetical protein